MILKYPNEFIVPVKRIKIENIREDMRLEDKKTERNLIYENSEDLIQEFKNNQKIWYNIDKYYCENEAGYI